MAIQVYGELDLNGNKIIDLATPTNPTDAATKAYADSVGGGGGGTPGIKVSAMTALTGANAAAGDLFTVMDVSDTSMAGTGTNKSMTLDEVVNALKLRGMQQVVRQSASDSNTSNTTLDNIPGLAFAVTSGRRYHFKFMGTYQTAATTTGMGMAFSGPSMTDFMAIYQMQQAAAGTDQFFQGTSLALTTVVTSTGVVAATTNYAWMVEGVLLPSAGGTIQLQYRSEVNTSNVTVQNTGVGILTDCGT